MPHVTIPDGEPWRSYVAAAGQTQFPIPFPFFSSGDIGVWLNGVRVTSGVAVSGILPDSQNGGTSFGTGLAPSQTGNLTGGFQAGVVTFSSAPLVGATVYIERFVAAYRLDDFPFPARVLDIRTLNTGLDRIIAMIQDTRNRLRRVVTVPVGESGLTLPRIADRAGKLLGFDDAGLPRVLTLEEASVPSGDVSLTTSRALGTPSIRTLSDRFGDRIHVRDFGAVGDGEHDDTPAIQAAINAMVQTGGLLHLGRGRFRTTAPLVVDESGVTVEDSTRIGIIGDGRGASVLLPRFSSGEAIRLKGGISAGAHSHQTLSGFAISSNGLVDGVVGDNLAYFALDSMFFEGCRYALSGSDILSSMFDSLVLRFNRYGIRLERENFSYPNNLTLLNCTVGANSEYGIFISGGTTVQLIGGSVEGNGWGKTGPDQWGVRMNNAGFEGAAGLNCLGVYFEGNAGMADVWIDQAANISSHTITGCTFNRISSANFTQFNIRAEAEQSVSVAVQGCGFKAFGDYGEDGARPYLYGGRNTHWDLGQANTFGALVATPRFSATPDIFAGFIGSFGIPANQHTVVPFNQQIWDEQQRFDLVTGAFTVGRICHVRIHAQVYLSGLTAGATVQLSIYTMAGVLQQRSVQVATGTSGTFALNCLMLTTSDGQYLLKVHHTGGSGVTLSLDASVNFLQVQAA